MDYLQMPSDSSHEDLRASQASAKLGVLRGATVRYGGAVPAALLALTLGRLLQPLLDPTVSFLTGIFFVAWFSGLGPAVLTSALSVLALDYFFTAPLYTLTPELAHIPRLAAFASIAALFASATASRRRSQRALRDTRDQLDTAVRERTVALTRANRRLETQYAVTRALADADSLEAALPAVLRIMGTTMSWDWGALWNVDEDAQVLRRAATWRAPRVSDCGGVSDDDVTFERGRGLPGQIWQTGQPRWMNDVDRDPGFVRSASAAEGGVRGAAAFPIIVSHGVIGVVEFFTSAVREPDVEELETLSSIGSQVGQFVERRRAEEQREQLLQARKASEGALREQADLLNLTHDAIFVRDMDAVIRYWNRGAEEMYGWSPEEAVGRVSHDLLKTIFPMPLERLAAQVVHEGRWEGELVHTTRSGTQVAVASRWSLKRDARGRPVAMLEINNDITDWKRAENALRTSEEQWKAVFENNPTMYFMVDAGATVLSVNPFGAQQLGYTVEELIGTSVLNGFAEPDRPTVRRKIAACLQAEHAITWEIPKVRRDGSRMWVRETAKAMQRTDGSQVVLIACEDITLRKRAEADLLESERRYRHIFQATAVSIWEEDFTLVKAAVEDLKRKGLRDFAQYLRSSPEFVEHAISMVRIVDVNEATVKLFDAPSKEALLSSLHNVFTPETRAVFAGEIVAIAEGRTAFEGESILQKLNGEQLVALFSVSFPPPEAPFDTVLVSIMDITDRKRAEHELQQLAGRLIHAQEEERSRIGRELHDHISQMLGVLTIRLDQLRADEGTPPALAAALETLRQSTSEITDDIHGLSHRLHSSALDYLGLVPALERLVSEFSTRHGIAIDFTHDAVAAPLASDVALCLFRITEESLTNIAKHSGAKSARVSIAETHDGISLGVEDSGAGFDMSGLERDRRAGLGFVSMRERLRALGGTFRIDAAPSRGTRIDVWVPSSSGGTRAGNGDTAPGSPSSSASAP